MRTNWGRATFAHDDIQHPLISTCACTRMHFAFDRTSKTSKSAYKPMRLYARNYGTQPALAILMHTKSQRAQHGSCYNNHKYTYTDCTHGITYMPVHIYTSWHFCTLREHFIQHARTRTHGLFINTHPAACLPTGTHIHSHSHMHTLPPSLTHSLTHSPSTMACAYRCPC